MTTIPFVFAQQTGPIPLSELDNNFLQCEITVQTIAALRSNTQSIASVFVQGYTTIADGGSGAFVLSTTDLTSPDNGGTIIVDAAGNRWYRAGLGGSAVSVKWFGATGNGTTDDTASIQNAMNAVSTITSPTTLAQCLVKGGEVYFPRGTYLFSSTLYINPNVHFVGEDCGPITQSPLAVTPPRGCAILLYNGSLTSIAVDVSGFWLTAQGVLTGTASAGGSGTITIGAGLAITQSVVIAIISGTGSGQSRPVSGYNSGTGVATVGWPWDTTPDNTSQWSIAGHNIGDRITQLISPGESAIETNGVGSYVPGVAIKNFAIVSNQFLTTSSSGNYEGLRLSVAPSVQVDNVLIWGFNVSLEEVGSSYGFFRGVASAALMTGFGWVQSDHATRVGCLDFAINAGIASITPATRPWFVDWMANEGLDVSPSYWTAHYFANICVGTSIGCDGEGGDRSYFLGDPTSETFIGCHMERWNHYGFYQNSGQAFWQGGDFLITAATQSGAFNGASMILTVDGVSADSGSANYAVAGSITGQFGGNVIIRNVTPGPLDAQPVYGSIVHWDAFPTSPSIITTGSAYTAAITDTAILVNKPGGSTTITLFSGYQVGVQAKPQIVTVADYSGAAGAFNIIVASVSGNLRGATTAVINSGFGTLRVQWNGIGRNPTIVV